MVHSPWRCGVWAALLLGVAAGPAAAQPVILFDYSLDSGGFFGAAGSAPRLALDAAATRLTNRLADTLTAIAPSGGNTWTPSFTNPTTGGAATLTNPSIPQHQILVFVGARELGGSVLGQGGPGGFSASGTTTFLNSLRRGQTGALGSAAGQTDFGPWGGSVAFDSVGTTWNFSLTGPVAGQADFLSVAEHELGHLLGIGTANSWDNLCNGATLTFTGPVSTALNGGANPSVTADFGHWGSGQSYLGQECAMTPSITIGTRKEFNELDYGGLDDLGWQVTPIPEPATVIGVAAVGLIGVWGARWRRGALVGGSAA